MPKGGKPAKRRSASFEELQAVDWNTVTKSKKVKYDPNRLIFGATEDGFMELEEVDMDEVNGMLGVTGGGGVASKAKDTSPSTPEDDAEPIKGAKKAVTKKTKADVAGKKASAEKKQSAAASLRRRSASFEELQAVDWDKMTKSTPIKYDPNRLIFGATEDGFMELEEVDMDEVNAMAVGGAAAPGKSGGQRQDVHSEANAADDDDDATAAGDDTSDGKPMSAKDARIAKRKARWKAKVEAAKQRKAEARAQAANARGGGAKTDKSSSRNADEDAEERYLSDESDDASDDDDAQDQAQDAASKDAGKATALTAEAKGDAKDQGWQMDYNNYPTAGMGAVVDGVDLDAGADVSNWLQFDLHPALLRALQDMKFTDPTPIQNDCLNPAIKGRCDVIGAAETGSGKTLAFGLPILHRILTQRDEEADESASDSESESIDKGKGGGGDGDANEGAEGAEEKADEDDPFALILDESGKAGAHAGMKLDRKRRALRALILAPTRELAMQVCDMLKAVAKHTDVDVVPVVGGMSLQKQERLLRRRPEIVVATPGRLWELMHQQGHEHFVDLGRLNFLVLDEADRMVERGHFRELHDIIDTLPIPPRIKRPPGAAKATPETLKVFKSRGKADPGKDPAPRGKKGGKGQKGGNAAIVDTDIVQEEEDGGLTGFNLRPSQILDRQTFVFSATLTVPDTVRRKLKKRHANAFAGPDDKKKAASGANAGTLASLMEAVPFYGRVKLVDLTDQSQTVAKGVSESSLECTEDERDALLYHILSQEPGLVIVFVNAISALRRLLAILKTLRLPVEGLHGNMQQRARLKYLDRFKKGGGGGGGKTSILVATDVAARGIDIKGVDLVVHYQVPMSADTYVHRSGRTGRANAEGASVMLVTPTERQRYRTLLRNLNRTAPLPSFPTVESAVAEAKRRMAIARKLEKLVHTKNKDRADAEWRKSNAEALGIELDSDEEGDATTVRVIENAKKTMKEKRKAKAAKAFAKAAAKKKAGEDQDAASDSESDSSGSESGSDDDDMMDDLVAKGFDPDDQTSHARLGAYERGEAEESRLRAALDAMLATPLGIKAAGRLGTASVRYPSRGDGGAKLARDMREKGGGGADAGGGGNAVMGSGGKVAAVKMLKAGKSEMGAMGAAPGGARGKKRRKGGLAGGARG